MNFTRLFKHPIACQLAIALGYIGAIRISTIFASLPGELTALWLPAVIGLIAYLELGKVALIGIALGTLIDSYFSLNSLFPDFSQGAIAILTLGIVVSECITAFVGATWLQKRHKNILAIFQTVDAIFDFFCISLYSAALSAILPTALFYLYGIIPLDTIFLSWLVQFLGASLAQIIFVPPILLWRSPHLPKPKIVKWELIIFVCLLAAISYVVFYKGYTIDYLFLPLLIWSVFRLEQPLPEILVVLLSIMGIVSTANGYGSFIKDSPHESLLFLESFIAVYAITILIVSAILNERQAATQKLNSTLDFLEERVFNRTSKLLQTQLILDAFIDTAPLAMAILDKELNLIKVNDFLAKFQQPSESLCIAQKYNLHPALQREITANSRLVLESTKANIRAEVYLPDLNSGSTWLMSYFPIFDEQGDVFRVGFIGLDISDRKRLELVLQKQAQLDGLTKIANRRKFDEVLEREWLRCQRDQKSLSLLLFDIDQFKAYNDTYGHVQGDECLIKIAQVLKKQIGRTTDLAARYGGEEFVILLSSTNLAGACYVAETILAAIRDLKIPHKNSTIRPFVTSSCGVVTCIPHEHLEMTDLVHHADQALYQAKSHGRNQTMVYKPSEDYETA